MSVAMAPAGAAATAWRCDDFAGAQRMLADFLAPSCPARTFVFQPRTGGTYEQCLCWHRYATFAGALRASWQYLLLQAAYAQPSSLLKRFALSACGARIHRRAYLSPQFFADPLFPSLLTIEAEVLVGVGVRIALHDQLGDRFRAGRVILRRGATLGADARIACGVEIGAGARVALGAVVLRDVPAGAFVVGNPARVVAARPGPS